MNLIEAAAHEHSEDEDEHEEDEEDEEEHEDEHSVDAHVWLGEENIFEIAGRIRTELIAIMPEQSATFIKNTEIFTQEVSSIYEIFKTEHE
jgi:zinc transport system substrate-binding protein